MTYIPDPSKYTMKGNAPRPEAEEQHQAAEDMSRISSLSRNELIDLVQRMARQCGIVACMNEEETAQAMLDTLAHTALRPIVAGLNMKADLDSRLKAIDKWLDRKQGKAIQRIDQRVQNVSLLPANEMTNEQILIELRKLSDAKQLPAGVQLLENGTLVDVEYEETTR